MRIVFFLKLIINWHHICRYIYFCTVFFSHCYKIHTVGTLVHSYIFARLPRWHSSEESTCQRRRCKRCGFDPCIRKIPFGDGHGSLACCDSWGRKVRHNWATELNFYLSALTFNILKFLKHEISNLTDRFTVAVNIQQYSGNVCSFNRLLYLKLKFLIVPEKFNNR